MQLANGNAPRLRRAASDYEPDRMPMACRTHSLWTHPKGCAQTVGGRDTRHPPLKVLFTLIEEPRRAPPPQEQGAHDLKVYKHVCTCTLSEWQRKYIGLLSDSQEWSAHLSPVLVSLPRSRRTTRRRAARTCAPPRRAGRGAPPWPGRSPQPAARPCAA
eukprot:scaffold122419_cov72-Phaeocystis_antarctica.AAC.2